MNSVFFGFLKQLSSITSNLFWQKRLIVLIYHRVLDQSDFMRPDEVDREAFAWQMDLLANYFNVLSVDDALARLKDNTLPARSICITFDDGYADNFYNALPILKERNLPACFFVASGYLDGGRMWNDTIIEAIRQTNESSIDLKEINFYNFDISSPLKKVAAAQALIRQIKHMPIAKKNICIDYVESLSKSLPRDLMLTSQQVKALSDNGMTIGCHTVTHPIFVNMSESEITREITESRATLQDIIGREISLFAYPNGKVGTDYLPEQTNIIRSLGLKAAFSTHLGSIKQDSDIWQLPRFRPWDKSAENFMLRLAYMYK